jgi:hypothetical protein
MRSSANRTREQARGVGACEPDERIALTGPSSERRKLHKMGTAVDG